MEENQKIANEINADIESGVYDQYEYLKSCLEKIAHRLVLSCYVSNINLSNRENRLLEENGYKN